MPEPQPIRTPRIAVEDLLRLKRGERPAPEFWKDFEVELRQKQLAALVERKSWWHFFSAVGGRFGRLRFPLGATAVLALSLISIRYYSQSLSEPRMAANQSAARQALAPKTLHPQVAIPVAVVALATKERASAEPRSSDVAIAKSPAVITASLPTPRRDVPGSLSWLSDVSASQSSAQALPPSVRSIAVNVASVEAEDPGLAEMIEQPRGFEERAMPSLRVRHTVEVLPTAAAMTEPRRARLLAALGSAGSYVPDITAPEHTQRNVTRYLAQDGWDRSIGRLEAEGDRLSIKF